MELVHEIYKDGEHVASVVYPGVSSPQETGVWLEVNPAVKVVCRRQASRDRSNDERHPVAREGSD